MKRIALIDGNSLINRAYYAMRNPMITREGIYTQGIFGFINMLDKIIKDYQPEYMAIAFDMKAPTFRHSQYDQYKAGRKRMPEELAMEIPILKDILDAMRITRLELEGYEADDIIGTLVRMGEEEGLEPLVFTGDRDQLQLATDTAKIIYTKRGVSEFDLYDRESFIEEYGFTPLQFIDYKGLAGDSSDNIPGIPGVGAKTATKLIREYGSVESIIENVDSIKPAGLQAKVRDNAAQAMLSKRLATIFTAVPLEMTINECLLQEPDYGRLIEIYKKLEFNRFLSKLKVKAGDKLSVSNADEDADEGRKRVQGLNIDDFTVNYIGDTAELNKIRLSGQVGLKVFGDNNHRSLPEIEGVALICEKEYYYIDIRNVENFADWFRRESGGAEFFGHDLKDSYYMLMCLTGCDSLNTHFDTAIAQYVLDPARSSYSLAGLSNEYLHESIEEEKDFLASQGQIDMFAEPGKALSEYGLLCLVTAGNLMELQKNRIEAEGLEKVLYDIELPLVQVMASMEKEGFRTDRAYLEEFGEDLAKAIDELADSIHEMAGEEFNINSPQQLGNILFEKLELKHGKKTKKGYSTSAEVLEKIKKDHPIVPAILEYRTLTKLKSTYIDGLLPLIDSQGRIHAHFQQTVTATGRISCTEPNLQNIPIRQELGRKLRKAFVPEENCILMGADYSQIELRVLAAISGDETLINAYAQAQDIHRITASQVFHIPFDEVTDLQRRNAKAVNFGIVYGISSFGLSQDLSITRKEAAQYIEKYFETYPGIKKFLDDTVENARKDGYVTTMFGRRRPMPELKSSNFMQRSFGERVAMNAPIQGTAADIIKIAMIHVNERIKKEGLKSRLILQIHDELLIEAEESEVDEVKKILLEEMQGAAKLSVKLEIDMHTGKNWYEAK